MEFDFSGPAAGGTAIGELRLLQILTEARNEHGMRQSEFERYRVYCTKKTHRLREIAKLTHVDDQHTSAKQLKAKKSAGRKTKRPTALQQSEAAKKLGGNHFTKKRVTTADIKNDSILLLLLFEAERNWAHSQELKAAAFEKGNDTQLAKQGVARARRSVQWAAHLVDALQALGDNVSPRTRLEAIAYLCIVRGSGSFDRSRHNEALQQTCVARKLLTFLAQHAQSAKDEAFSNSFIDAGEAQIRFSAYQLELDEQNLDVIEQGVADEEVCEKWASGHVDLMKQVAAASGKSKVSTDASSTVTWRGRTIRIRNPDLLDAVKNAKKEEELLAQALEHESTLKDGSADASALTKKPKRAIGEKPTRFKHSDRNAHRKASGGRKLRVSSTKNGMDPFDRALSAAADAERLSAELVEDNAAALAKSHSSRYQAVNDELKAAHDYLLYSLLSLRIRRNDHLVKQVEQKAERREKRAREAMDVRIQNAGKKPTSGGKHKRKEQKNKPAEKKAKKSGSKAKKPRKQPKVFKRRPAHGGSKRRRDTQTKARVEQLRLMAEEKSKRRRARAVPALAKLLDSVEASLSGIAGLQLVETEADASSLIDAKIAWYRSELLRQLAKAFSLSRAYPHAVLLLNRAQLFIRQAGSALELASNVDKENHALPPFLSEKTLSAASESLAQAKKTVQKDMFNDMRKGAAAAPLPQASAMKGDAMGESNAAAALRELAAKYVDFDPALLEDAKRVPPEVLREVQTESMPGKAKPVKQKQPAASTPAAAPKAARAASPQDEDEEADAFEEAEAGEADGTDDEAFEDPQDAQDAEDDEAEPEQKKGWFGGWLRRG